MKKIYLDSIFDLKMLYIRHGEKQFENKKSDIFSLDPGLTQQGKIKAEKHFYDLLDTYVMPESIITSPYLRARETSHIAQNSIYNKTGIWIPVFIDIDLGEYLGNHTGSDLSKELTPGTLHYNPIPIENWQKFSDRIEGYFSREKINKSKNIWHITHGLVIQTIAKLYGTRIQRPHELHGILISNDKVNII